MKGVMLGRIRLEHCHQELMVVMSVEVWHQIFKIQDQRCPWVSVGESWKDCVEGGVHDRAGLGRVFQSSQKTAERCVSGGVKKIWFFFLWRSRSMWDVIRSRSWCGGVSGLQEKLQSDISVGIHRGFGWRVGGYRCWGPDGAPTGTRICCSRKPVVDYPIVVEWEGAVEVSWFQWDSRSTDNVIFNVNPKPLWAGTGSGGDGDEYGYRESPLIKRWGEDFSGHCVFPWGLEFDGNVAGVGSPGRVYTRTNSFSEDALEGGGVAITPTYCIISSIAEVETEYVGVW